MKNPSKFISTLYTIKRARFNSGHITKNTLKLALRRLSSKLHQRMCFSQWNHLKPKPFETKKQINIECQKLLPLILVSNSQRYSLNYKPDAMLFFANLFGHFLARESAKSIFPNIPARRQYLEKITPKLLKTHKYLSIIINSKQRLVKLWPCAFALKTLDLVRFVLILFFCWFRSFFFHVTKIVFSGTNDVANYFNTNISTLKQGQWWNVIG